MKIKFPLLLLSFFLLFNGCEDEDPNFKPLIIGTFNIEWLGDGINDRLERNYDDYKRIADVIKTADYDVVGLQEVENKEALDRVIMHLPEYKYYVGQKGGSQNLAVVYKENIDVKYLGEYLSLAIEPNRHRPGLVIEGKKGNFDWIMMVVHFKATSRWDNTPEKKAQSYDIRRQQAEIVSRWADSVLAIGKEEDIFIVGDINDTPKRKKNNTIESLINNEKLFFLTAELKSCKYRGLYVIDHVVCSEAALSRFKDNSTYQINLYYMFDEEIANMISDHCPMVTSFDVKAPDND
jgi:exonuclease III